MANISAAFGGTFDASQVEPSAPRELLPPGTYTAQIVKSDMVDTSTGGQMLKLELDILEGPSKGRKLWDNLNLVNRNPTAVEIAQRTLSAICHAIGRLQVADSDELHFKPLTITVAVEPDSRDKHLAADDPARRYQNAVKGYAAASGVASPAQRPAPMQQAAPPPRQAAAPTGAAPWRRSA